MRQSSVAEDRKRLRQLKGAAVEEKPTQEMLLPEGKVEEVTVAPVSSPRDAAAEASLARQDWREYSNAQNLLMLQRFMDLDELDLNYDLMTRYDPNELTNDVKYFIECLKNPNLTKFQKKTLEAGFEESRRKLKRYLQYNSIASQLESQKATE